MRLVSFEVQTVLGRFERIGALAHGTIVDLNAACTAYFAVTEEFSAARRQAAALVPPDMIAFLEGCASAQAVGREMAEKSVAYVAERLQQEAQPLGPDNQRLTYSETEIRWLAPVPRPPMIRDGILLLDHYLYCVNKYGILPTSSYIQGDLSWEADWKRALNATPRR